MKPGLEIDAACFGWAITQKCVERAVEWCGGSMLSVGNAVRMVAYALSPNNRTRIVAE
jgi:hypothetical protein